MDELLKALENLNAELVRDDIVLNLNIVVGFSLFLQNLDIEVRPSHDIDAMSRLTDDVKKRVRDIGEELDIDLRWLNDDILSLYDEFEFAGIHPEQLRFGPNSRIDFSNIHLNVIDISDFVRLKLFSIFMDVHDFMQYNKSFDREQDLQDIKTIVEISDIDHTVILNSITSHVQGDKYGALTQALIDTYLDSPLSNLQINDFLKEGRWNIQKVPLPRASLVQ
ncbi:MAG: hypothetical protein LBK67_09615 [Coriobacteriales bacterium]|jgi:hypothetical protein|nr:hypothetical protein [Coriobacteriales bacterium]